MWADSNVKTGSEALMKYVIFVLRPTLRSTFLVSVSASEVWWHWGISSQGFLSVSASCYRANVGWTQPKHQVMGKSLRRSCVSNYFIPQHPWVLLVIWLFYATPAVDLHACLVKQFFIIISPTLYFHQVYFYSATHSSIQVPTGN